MRHLDWRRATLIAATVNLALFFTALSVLDGAWQAAWGHPDPLWIAFVFLPPVASTVVVYAAAAWLSRSKVASPNLAPAVFVMFGVIAYGHVMFHGPIDPDTAQQMAVFFTGPMEFALLTLTFALTWLTVRWVRRFTESKPAGPRPNS